MKTMCRHWYQETTMYIWHLMFGVQRFDYGRCSDGCGLFSYIHSNIASCSTVISRALETKWLAGLSMSKQTSRSEQTRIQSKAKQLCHLINVHKALHSFTVEGTGWLLHFVQGLQPTVLQLFLRYSCRNLQVSTECIITKCKVGKWSKICKNNEVVLWCGYMRSFDLFWMSESIAYAGSSVS